MTVEIQLSQGKVGLIDDEDAERVNKYKWQAIQPKKGYTFYAMSKIDGKLTYLHRFITGAGKGEEVDHLNRDGLDNRRSNLNKCSHAENIHRSRRRAGVKSPYKGVFQVTRYGKIENRAYLCGKYLGTFSTPEAAAMAYNAAALAHYGSHAATNNIPAQAGAQA